MVRSESRSVRPPARRLLLLLLFQTSVLLNASLALNSLDSVDSSASSVCAAFTRSDSRSSTVASLLVSTLLIDRCLPSILPTPPTPSTPLAAAAVSHFHQSEVFAAIPPPTVTASALNLHGGFNNGCPEDTSGTADVIFLFMCDEKLRCYCNWISILKRRFETSAKSPDVYFKGPACIR